MYVLNHSGAKQIFISVSEFRFKNAPTLINSVTNVYC